MELGINENWQDSDDIEISTKVEAIENLLYDLSSRIDIDSTFTQFTINWINNFYDYYYDSPIDDPEIIEDSILFEVKTILEIIDDKWVEDIELFEDIRSILKS